MAKEKNNSNNQAAQEKRCLIVWEGFTVDLFLTEDGNLGITVDRSCAERVEGVEVDTFVDIYVDKDTLRVSSI